MNQAQAIERIDTLLAGIELIREEALKMKTAFAPKAKKSARQTKMDEQVARVLAKRNKTIAKQQSKTTTPAFETVRR